jgi:hypothetical protein
MAHPDDYRDEMERLSSQDADDLLSGGRPKAAAARVAAAAADRLRRELLVTPGLEVSRRHLAAMRAAAGSENLRKGGTAMRKQAKKRVAALGLAATLVLGAGIAAALTLPDQASDEAKERTAEVEAPNGPGNQGENGSIQSETASEHGKDVSAVAQDDSLQGCEKGRAVSAIAASKAEDNRKNEPNGSDPCAASDGYNAGGLGKSNAGGQGKSNAGGQGKSNAGGQGKSNAGGQSSSARTQDSSAGGPPDGKGAPLDLPTPGE